jgi:iron complex outermembrane receptor protein
MSSQSILLRSAILAALGAVSMPLAAQDTEDADDRALDTIVVTAQKREQSLQDVPIVVTTISAQLLQDTGVEDIKDLTLLTPGLIVTSTTSETVTTARIRGIGTVGDNPGLESSVGVVIDGVYRPRNGVSFGDLGELERIEVLKGPQGTLFGKNTSAGVINVVTKRPSFEFGSQVELTAGDYGELGGSASITGPLSDKVAGRLYVAARERDGFLDVVTGPGPRTQKEDFDRSFYTVRGQLLFEPTDNLDLRLVVDYTDRDENCCLGTHVVLSPNPAVLQVLNALQPGSFADPADPFARRAYANRSTEQQIEDQGVSLEVNWDLDALGGATLTSVTAWRNWETVNGQDSDFTTVDILYRAPDGSYSNEFTQFSEEIRLAGESERLSWLVGAFYADEELKSNNALTYGTQFADYFGGLLQAPPQLAPILATYAPGTGQTDRFKQNSKSWALFTNNSIRFTDAFEMTLGLRYTDESKDLDSFYFNSSAPGVAPGFGCTFLRANLATVSGLLQARFASLPPDQQAAAVAAGLRSVYGIGCATYADPLFNNLATSQTIDENEWSGTIKLAYRFTDDVMSYVSYARGYKASGFNLDRERTNNNVSNNPLDPAGPIAADIDTSFDKELVDSYELGLKTDWLGNTLLVNGAVFYQEYENFQLNTFTGISFVVTSLPKVVSKGVDLDFLWNTPLRQLSLQGGVTYADTKIEEFGDAIAFFRPERKDDRLSFAPKWSGSLAATYEQPIGNALVFRGNIGAKYTSEYNTGSNLDPRKQQDAMTLVNARIGLGAANESWTVELWAQNLTDEEYFQVAYDATLQGSSADLPLPTNTVNAFLGAPRTFGITARFKF